MMRPRLPIFREIVSEKDKLKVEKLFSAGNEFMPSSQDTTESLDQSGDCNSDVSSEGIESPLNLSFL